MQPNLKSHIEFCKAVADGSTYKDAYKTYVSRKVNVSDAVCEKDGSLLAKKYATYIQDLKQRISTAIDKAHENSVLNGTLEGILTKAERMKILSDIARGELLVSKPFFTKDGAIDAYVQPDHTDRKNAISELNKMDGSYAPKKIDAEIRDLRPLFPDDDELLKDEKE